MPYEPCDATPFSGKTLSCVPSQEIEKLGDPEGHDAMNGPPFDAEVAHAVPEPGAAPLSAWYVLIAVCTEAKSASHAASQAGGTAWAMV